MLKAIKPNVAEIIRPKWWKVRLCHKGSSLMISSVNVVLHFIFFCWSEVLLAMRNSMISSFQAFSSAMMGSFVRRETATGIEVYEAGRAGGVDVS